MKGARVKRIAICSLLGIVTITTLSFICCHPRYFASQLRLTTAESHHAQEKDISEPESGTAAAREATQASAPIFFVETSGQPNLTLRAACAVESAALHHPRHTVTMYSMAPFHQNDSCHQTLGKIANIKYELLDLKKVFEETPMEEWNDKGATNESYFPVTHLSDAVRIALLWTLGGVYLDTDAIVVRPLVTLPNAIGLEISGVANGAVLVFERWSSFIYQCMVDFVKNYDKDEWGAEGPLLFTRMLQRICRTDSIDDVVGKPEACQGVTILPIHKFYPVSYNDMGVLFDHGRNNRSSIRGAYTVHLWNEVSKQMIATPGNGTFLEVLAKENCPSVYRLMQHRGTI